MSNETQKQSFINPATAAGLGAGALSALLYLALQLASPGAMIFAYLSPLPLYAAGLGLGPVVVLIAGATGALLTLALGGGKDALLFAVLNAAPAIWMVRLALISRTDEQGRQEWYPAGRLAAWLSISAAGYFIVALVLAAMFGNGLWDSLEGFAREMVAGLAAANGQEPAPVLHELTARASTWAPAMLGISWMTMQVINATLAQGLLSRFARNQRPSPDLAAFRVPGPLVYALVVTLALSMIDGQVGLIARTLAVFIAFPFLFAGLAVVHALIRKLAARNILLVVFYILLFMLGWPLVLVAGLGLMDQWVDFRRRFAGVGNDLDNGPQGGPQSGGPDGNQEEK